MGCNQCRRRNLQCYPPPEYKHPKGDIPPQKSASVDSELIHRGSSVSTACVYCSNLKVRCDYEENSTSCKRCRSSGRQCQLPVRRNTKQKENEVRSVLLREQAEQIRHLSLMACVNCSNQKIRCDYDEDSASCRRCRSIGLECQLPAQRNRKERNHEVRSVLLDKIREQTEQIRHLRAKLAAIQGLA